jgi:hypothetical protein
MRCRLLYLSAVSCALAAPEPAVQFNRDIRPILSEHCYACHGPDERKRESKLRLDVEVTAKSDLGGRSAIVPGEPASSELLRRVTASDTAAACRPPIPARRSFPAVKSAC